MAQDTQREKKHATIVDVAERAGVAISTVSHVLNKTAPISDETCRRVQAAIAELDYIPNILAKNLRQQRSNTIGVVVPDISNEFYANVASAIFRQADAWMDTIMLVDSCYSLEKEQVQVQSLVQRQVDGLIFLGGFRDEALIDWADRQGVAVVLGDRQYGKFCSVECDNYEAMRHLVNWAYGKGFRKIGYVTESLEMTNLQNRYSGLCAGFQDCGLTMDERWILNEQSLQMDKVDAARTLMNERILSLGRKQLPEIIFTSSDMIAVGILNALREQGFHVPGDISIVGFDDIRLVQYYHPAITTIRQDWQRIGEECYHLLSRVMKDQVKNEHIFLKTELVERETVSLRSICS